MIYILKKSLITYLHRNTAINYVDIAHFLGLHMKYAIMPLQYIIEYICQLIHITKRVLKK